MRIVSFSALFPPYSHGGAENSAANLARWFASNGHEVHAISAATKLDDVHPDGEMSHGVRVWRREFPRPYPVFEFMNAPKWKKPLWHLQDHFDARNRRIVGELLDRIQPDAAVIHYLPGIGYNVLKEISSRGIPSTYYLHDLGLACVRMSMFRRGKDCGKQCGMCKAASAYKNQLIADFDRIGFCSPSRANLERVESYIPIQTRLRTAIPNARRYDPPTAKRKGSSVLRLMYVGRLHPQKGVTVALQAAARLNTTKISFRIVGGGQSESDLRAQFGKLPWCSFTGHLTPEAVGNEMVNADVLLVPSIWAENLPGVVIQALGLGIPVIASNVGGVPELVDHGRTGLLVEPGNVDAWQSALQSVLDDPGALEAMRVAAAQRAIEFDQDSLGRRHHQFLMDVMSAAAPGTASIAAAATA